MTDIVKTSTQLLSSIKTTINLEMECGLIPPTASHLLPIDWIRYAGTEALLGQSLAQIFAWHRDLCWALASVEESNDPSNLAQQDACIRLSVLIGEVPRDTVYTYAVRAYSNQPTSFSQTIQETDFILGLREASKVLGRMTAVALTFHTLKIDDEATKAKLVAELLEYAPLLRKIMSQVIRKVDIATFVNQIEPNFQRKMINGTQYYGPTASQLPLVSLELLLHGRDSRESLRKHASFQQKYMPRAYQAINIFAATATPLLYHVLSRTVSDQIEKSLYQFRKIHLAIALKAFDLQESPSQKAREILEDLMRK